MQIKNFPIDLIPKSNTFPESSNSISTCMRTSYSGFLLPLALIGMVY